MKKSIYFMAAMLLAGAASSCTDKDYIEPAPYDTPLYLEISTSKVVFGKEGGTASVVAATNADVLQVEVDQESGFSVETSADNRTVIITAASNYSAELRTSSLTVTATKGDAVRTATVSLVQRAVQAVNLSAGGLANCYVAGTNGTYSFRADIKGNGSNQDGRSRYISLYGVAIKDIAYADLLWESRNDGDRTLSYEVIDGTPIYHGGYVTFSTGRSQGNAAIAVKDINGDILWSWHIWVTDNEISSHDHIGAKGGVVAQIMDRNLGALNNEPMDIDNRGMLYQWGRKDPFPTSRSPYTLDSIDELDKVYHNRPNLEVGDGSGEWLISKTYTCPKVSEAPGNIPYAVKNPMMYLGMFSTNSLSTWYASSAASVEVAQPALWGDEKTLFDPCPAGYKVPGAQLFGDPSGSVSVITGAIGDTDEYGNPYLWKSQSGLGRTWASTGDFFPMTGHIATTTSERWNHYTGGMGIYWTSEMEPEGLGTGGSSRAMAFRIYFNANFARYNNGGMVYAAQIRCVKE